MPRKIHAKSTQNSRSFRIQAAGGKINFCGQDLVALRKISAFLLSQYAVTIRYRDNGTVLYLPSSSKSLPRSKAQR